MTLPMFLQRSVYLEVRHLVLHCVLEFLLSFELQINLPCFRGVLFGHFCVYQITVKLFFNNSVSSLTKFLLLHLSVIKKIAQYIGEVMEDSKDKVQENLLANGGRCCECGGLNALMLLLAPEYEYVELKPSHFRKEHFIRMCLAWSHFSQQKLTLE